MTKEDFSDRLDKVDDRIKALLIKFPLVFIAVFLLGGLTGALITAIAILT